MDKTETYPDCSNVSKTSLNAQERSWCFSLFGTAVGAGILFLPINAGLGGFWPLVIMTLLIGPMTYFSHRGLARLVLSSKNQKSTLVDVIEEHFGKNAAYLVAILSFFAFYPILLIYGNSLTNTVDNFIAHQMGLAVMDEGTIVSSIVPRWLLSLILITGMVSVMACSRNFMLKITQWLVYPLVVILLGLSIYLIPSWQMSAISFDHLPTTSEFINVLWLTIPVLVFSFNHSPAISAFAVAQKEHAGNQAVERSDAILKQTSSLLLIFIMMFVFSCVMSLTPAQLIEAKQQNISILSYLANQSNNPVIAYLGPFVAFIAIVSSFFGHYLGTHDGIKGLIHRSQIRCLADKKDTSINRMILIFMIVSIWLVTLVNPSVLGIIESFGGPIIAGLLYLLPMYAIKHVPAMQRYQGYASNKFVIMMGLISISAIVFQLVK